MIIRQASAILAVAASTSMHTHFAAAEVISTDATTTASTTASTTTHNNPELHAPFADAPPDPNSVLRSNTHPDMVLQRIAFGSCYKHQRETTAWDAMARRKPDLFLFIGDNVYNDCREVVFNAQDPMDNLVQHYKALSAVPEFAAFRATVPILATWDDHDFGLNDQGRNYPHKFRAQELFCAFWDPYDAERRSSPGIYDAETFGPEGQRVQIILLDTRFFRDDLEQGPPEPSAVRGIWGRYVPTTDTSKTLLGDDQWAWLEARLREPADLRIIASSIQVIADDHRFEKWGNFPHERYRLLELIRTTQANGVVFISGDRHRAELSLMDPAREPDPAAADVGYPLYDLTSSAITQSRGNFTNEINRHRLGSMLFDNNFGMIEVNWNARSLTLSLHTTDGQRVLERVLSLDKLQHNTNSR